MKWLALLLLSACSSQRYTYAPATFPDLPRALTAIRCAVERVDGAELAARVLNAEIQSSPGYAARNGMDSTYWPRPDGSVLIILDADADSAWHSGLRYELLCRWRLYLLGHPERCTRESWEHEIKPRYTPALSACFREGS